VTLRAPGGVRSRLGGVSARPLARRDARAALALLGADARRDLFLLDLVAGQGAPPAPGESPTELVGLWRRRALVGVGAIRPCIVLAAGLDPDAVAAFLPCLDGFLSGLVKTPAETGDAIWGRIAENGRRAIVDRTEVTHVLEPATIAGWPEPDDGIVRDARPEDLPALVEAARASLREEGRPDPFDGDPEGFRRWVRGRLPRACVALEDGRVAFVGYADVRRPEGWLLQGVYTWPRARRRGLARRGVASLCRRAFAGGAEHVQLSVVEGNAPAVALYAGLGFRPFARLRTILFGS
jgi:RimJ/RimL family protein N-acetyltransferase